jgi:nucleotide-binding universal stress UspA family protein
MAIRRILCPIDFSDASAHALEQAAALARWYGARVTVLHVHLTIARAPGVPTPDAAVVQLPTAADVEALRAHAITACRPVAEAGVGLDVVITAGEPVRTILDQAAQLPADIIVMGTHGTSGFQHLLLGSVTEKVLRKATCPVLTVPPRAQTTSAQPFARLLCAVDFSDSSLKAVDVAASLARESGAALTLLHVLEWPWHEPPLPSMEGIPPEQARALVEYRQYLETSAASRLQAIAASAMPDGPAPTVQVRFGKPYAELGTEAERLSLLYTIEHGAFFQKLKGHLVVAFYDNEAVWPLFGYEGSSWEKGGYANRGFDDIDWLPADA